MSAMTKELEAICQRLPAEKVAEVIDFARFLSEQASTQPGAATEDGDAAWERILRHPRPRPKLDAFVEASLSEGEGQPLDLGNL